MQNKTLTRRTLMTSMAVGMTAGLSASRALADDLPKLAVTDPRAQALGYVTDATQVDAKKYPAFVAGSNCENCLQLQGKAGNTYRPCSLFPGSLVSVSGWCSGWTAEM